MTATALLGTPSGQTCSVLLAFTLWFFPRAYSVALPAFRGGRYLAQRSPGPPEAKPVRTGLRTLASLSSSCLL